VAEKRL